MMLGQGTPDSTLMMLGIVVVSDRKIRDDLGVGVEGETPDRVVNEVPPDDPGDEKGERDCFGEEKEGDLYSPP